MKEEESLNLTSAIWFAWGVLLNSGIGIIIMRMVTMMTVLLMAMMIKEEESLVMVTMVSTSSNLVSPQEREPRGPSLQESWAWSVPPPSSPSSCSD